jgi:putative transposase
MTIVPVGNLILQVPVGDHEEFVRSLTQQMQAYAPRIFQRILEASLDAEVDKWLAGKRYVRRRKSKRQEGKACCSRCLSHQRRKFQRNGHYTRGLITQWGKLHVSVPQVKCECGGNVKMTFQTIRPRQRIWEDVGLEVQVEYDQGLSYRQIKARLDEQLGTSLGLGTLNRQVLQGAADEIGFNFLGWESVPAVVRLDGIWITVMFPTGETQRDRQGRQRPVKRAKRIPILAAQGVWPTTGRTALIAWMLADGEDLLSWQKFLEHLYGAGLTPENGLKMLAVDGSAGFKAAYENVYWMVPLQRCVFHKLRNAARALRTPADLDRQAAHEYRTQFLRQASRIWQASDEHEARLLHATFCKTWQAQQPKAVQTLIRDLDETLTFFAVQQAASDQGQFWPAYLLRTTSPLERMFREFRRRFRNALLFHSAAGAQAVTAQIASRFS